VKKLLRRIQAMELERAALIAENDELKAKKSGAKEEDKNDGSGANPIQNAQAPEVKGLGMDLADMMAVAHLEVPSYRFVDKGSWKVFLKRYKEYKMRCPTRMIKPICELIGMDVLEAVELLSEVEVEDLKKMDEDKLVDMIFRLFRTMSLEEASSRMRNLKMRADDLQLSTLLAFKADWDFELQCLGGMLPEKTLKRLFIKGLQPYGLRNAVEMLSPDSVKEAFQLAAGQLDFQRAIALQKKADEDWRAQKKQGAKQRSTQDQKPQIDADGQERKPQGGVRARKPLRCFNCDQEGHKAMECTKPKKQIAEKRGQDHTSRRLIRGGESLLVSDDQLRMSKMDQLPRLSASLEGMTWKVLVDSGATSIPSAQI
jgi:hypothetical protein